MAGFIFIIIVLLMLIGACAIFWNGLGMLFVDPQPSYFIVEEEEEPEPRRALRYYPPKDHGPIYREMLSSFQGR